MTDGNDGIITLKGKLYPTWPYVLNAAHDRGLLGITTKLIQIPTDENGNVAIVAAIARFADQEWCALGDASPKNVNAAIVTALIRMAETRAKGRALRDACNIGETMREEIGDDDLPINAAAAPVGVARAVNQTNGQESVNCEECGVVLTSGQHMVSQRSYKKSLCPAHQRAVAEKIVSRPAV